MIQAYGPIVVGMICLLTGFYLIWSAKRKMALAGVAATTWSAVNGRVLKSSKRMANLGSAKSRNKRSNSYLLDFEFEYEVNGDRYTSTKPLFFGLSLYDEIEEFLARYPQGSEVSVYHDPTDPRQAVLETTVHRKSGKNVIGFGVLLIVVGAMLIATRAF